MTAKKVVQTELGQEEYEVLSAAARREGLTIKEAARRALLEWSMSGIDLKQDPLFRLRPVKFKEKIRSSDIDRFLYHPLKVLVGKKPYRRHIPVAELEKKLEAR